MRRTVSADVSFTTIAGATRVVMQMAVARVPGLDIDETLTVTLDGEPLTPVEVPTAHGGLMHTFDFAPETPWGKKVQVRYAATVTSDANLPTSAPDNPDDRDIYLRPSRYAESDRMLPVARREFGKTTGLELVDAVSAFVHQHLRYVPGSSRFTDGSVETFLAGAGVCRDYAHLTASLLRGLDVPARVVAVYAPGLAPMDFHAVTEAWVYGRWYVVDGTRLAPRPALLRISTGRDAADTAFLSSYGSGILMGPQSVMATIDGDLPTDDHTDAIQMA
ncbi:transglutaminase-like domain-containing protein [Pseudactinotalea suaedae]|uniref:transglutaminase-like domain-containing protein n=1 Tax=Pseudactinotalea suaedae TaxID=1524924 RepID=UPI0012E1D1ED|nr:transglutaminase domain-containing protein [Pseudactinotalea suaedae]